VGCSLPDSVIKCRADVSKQQQRMKPAKAFTLSRRSVIANGNVRVYINKTSLVDKLFVRPAIRSGHVIYTLPIFFEADYN